MNSQLVEMDDRSLIERFLAHNDSDAMGVLFERHADMAYRTAMRVMRNASDAEEAVQAAFVTALRSAGKYRGGHGVSVWLMKIVVGTCNNKIRESVRRRQREERATMEQDMTASSDTERAQEMGETVKAMLDGLPERYRIPLWLHHHEGLSFRDAAQVLSVSEVTLRTQVKRGLDMLRGNLERAGVSMPMASMLAVFPSLPVETAPTSLVGGIGNIIHGVGSFAEAAGGAAGNSLMAGKVAWIVAAGLVAAAAGGAVLWMTRSEPLAPASSRSEIILSCDFDTPAVPRQVVTTPESWSHIPRGGVNGSGCRETTGQLFEAILDVSSGELPLLLTYTEAVVPPVDAGGYAAILCWKEYQQVAMLKNIARMHQTPMIGGERGEWVEWKLYITDSWIGGWQFGRLTALMVFEGKQGSKLSWIMRGRHRVDNLQVRTIRPEELPDVSPYLKALEGIPPAQRTGTVPLPGVPPVIPGKPVMVLFDGPAS